MGVVVDVRLTDRGRVPELASESGRASHHDDAGDLLHDRGLQQPRHHEVRVRADRDDRDLTRMIEDLAGDELGCRHLTRSESRLDPTFAVTQAVLSVDERRHGALRQIEG